jgi:hypothetical protein
MKGGCQPAALLARRRCDHLARRSQNLRAPPPYFCYQRGADKNGRVRAPDQGRSGLPGPARPFQVSKLKPAASPKALRSTRISISCKQGLVCAAHRVDRKDGPGASAPNGLFTPKGSQRLDQPVVDGQLANGGRFATPGMTRPSNPARCPGRLHLAQLRPTRSAGARLQCARQKLPCKCQDTNPASRPPTSRAVAISSAAGMEENRAAHHRLTQVPAHFSQDFGILVVGDGLDDGSRAAGRVARLEDA